MKKKSYRMISVCNWHVSSGRKYVYHNIHLETALNHKEGYKSIKWIIPSASNKQKLQAFKLHTTRKCSFAISPNGTVNISIECTHRPFEFHTSSGLMDFIASCGQIFNLLQLETENRLNVVPMVGNWYLMQFDYDKDISVKYLQDKFPTRVISGTSKGVLKLDHLGTIFQIYCKEMPCVGECLRFEGHYNTKEKVKMKHMVADIVAADITGERNHPFTTVWSRCFCRQEVRANTSNANGVTRSFTPSNKMLL